MRTKSCFPNMYCSISTHDAITMEMKSSLDIVVVQLCVLERKPVIGVNLVRIAWIFSSKCHVIFVISFMFERNWISRVKLNFLFITKSKLVITFIMCVCLFFYAPGTWFQPQVVIATYRSKSVIFFVMCFYICKCLTLLVVKNVWAESYL